MIGVTFSANDAVKANEADVDVAAYDELVAVSLLFACDDDNANVAIVAYDADVAVNAKSLISLCDDEIAYDADTAYEAVTGTFRATSATNACEALVEVCAYEAEILASAVVAYEAVTSRFEIKLPLPSVNSEPLIWTKPS